jgi:hypothetical protein
MESSPVREISCLTPDLWFFYNPGKISNSQRNDAHAGRVGEHVFRCRTDEY